MHHDISIVHSVYVVTDIETSMVMIIDKDGDECGIIVYEGINERNTTYFISLHHKVMIVLLIVKLDC